MTGVWILFLLGVIVCLEIIPERVNVIYVNQKYVQNYRSYVRRAGRRLPYMINFEGTIMCTMGDNVTLDFQFFEYLHNEYKPSFIQMKFKACDLFKDYFFGEFLRLTGVECPLHAGNYSLNNLTFLNIPGINNFPYKWPFEKGKVFITVRLTYEEGLIGEGEVFFTMKQSKKFDKGSDTRKSKHLL